MSVGEPYYNRMSVPIFLALLLLMGIGPALPWGRASAQMVRRALLRPLPAALVAFGLVWILGGRSWSVLLTAALAGYALWVTTDQALRPARSRAAQGEGAGEAVRRSVLRSPRRLGAYVVHFGVILTFASVAISANYQTSHEATLRPGETMDVGGYQLTFADSRVEELPHMVAQKAEIQVVRNGVALGELAPSINHYPTQREPLGTPAVRTSATHDLYLTLMNVAGDGSIGLRAIVTPAVVWIWIGVMVMALGTLMCLLRPRRGLTT